MTTRTLECCDTAKMKENFMENEKLHFTALAKQCPNCVNPEREPNRGTHAILGNGEHERKTEVVICTYDQIEDLCKTDVDWLDARHTTPHNKQTADTNDRKPLRHQTRQQMRNEMCAERRFFCINAIAESANERKTMVQNTLNAI